MQDYYKFRGLTKEGKEVKGGLMLSKDNLRAFIGYIEPLDDRGEVCVAHYDEVLPETVGMFTGQWDRTNNVQVCEHDLCRVRPLFDYPSEAERIFKEKVFKVIWSEKESSFLLSERCDYLFAFNEVEEVVVIGNIHKNPELLVETA